MAGSQMNRRQLMVGTGLILTIGLQQSVKAASLAEVMLAEVNTRRKQKHLTPLILDTRLVSAAEGFSTALMQRGELDLKASTGSELKDRLTRVGFDYRFAVENIASGPQTPEETVALWMQSEHHRRNILHPTVTHAGAGRAEHPNSVALHGFQYYWALILAKPA